MLKIYTFVILLIFTYTLSVEQTIQKGIIQIQPSALQSLRRYFNPIVVLFQNGASKQIQDKFIDAVKIINSTFSNKQLLFGMIDTKDDVINSVSKYHNKLPCVQIFTKKFNYEFTSQDLQKLPTFFEQTIYPKLPSAGQDYFPNSHRLLFTYTNQSDYEYFQSVYRKVKQQLIEYNVVAQSIFGNTKQISIITKEGKKIDYESDINQLNDIMQFINLQTIQVVTILNDDNYPRVFGSGIDRQVILVINQTAQSQIQIQNIKKVFHQVANYNKFQQLRYERMIFAISTMKFSQQFFGDMVEDLANSSYKLLITRTDFRAFQLQRYLYNKETFDNKSLIQFIQDFRMKRLSPYYRSQKRPTTQEGQLFKIVGKTFQQSIYGVKQSVLVLFIDSKDPESYAKWQEQTIKFSKTYKQFLQQKLIVGIFDLALNQHALLHLDYAPQLILFQKSNKKKAKSFRGQVTQQNIKEWTNFWIKDLNIPDNFGKQTLALGNDL